MEISQKVEWFCCLNSAPKNKEEIWGLSQIYQNSFPCQTGLETHENICPVRLLVLPASARVGNVTSTSTSFHVVFQHPCCHARPGQRCSKAQTTGGDGNKHRDILYRSFIYCLICIFVRIAVNTLSIKWHYHNFNFTSTFSLQKPPVRSRHLLDASSHIGWKMDWDPADKFPT